ncbi:MAG: LamG-like jellyroll fold domain-containing protein, partial [Pirellulales bacterium]
MNTMKEYCGRTVPVIALVGLVVVGCVARVSTDAAEPADGGTESQGLPTIADKTLVAWGYLANTTQRAGSLLTLIDDRERFDAVVFAERSAGKWMAGSDFFRRTPGDQSGYPTETADEETLVQMAIAYRGNVITIYRNADQYAQYEIGQPQSFDRNATVLLGLRYVGGMGEIGFFQGTIEEARIYDTALDAATIAALEPNRPSDPEPIGLWTFEDGTAADSTSNFPTGELRGGARIADGKLYLDGKDSYVEIYRPRPVVVQSMFYKARSRETGNMWDTWLYLHKGTYCLFYLANRGASWNNISMATSPDGVHWKEHGRVLAKREDATRMGTGSTWRSPNYEQDGKFLMNFSEWRGPRQTIFFAEATDLLMMFGTKVAGGHGMVTLVADRPEGPFRAAKKNFALLTGHTYFSRFFPTPDGVLVNHHAIARTGAGVYFGLLKSAVVDDEGTLRLGWWNGNETMKHEAVRVELPTGRDARVAMMETTFDVTQGVILEGTLTLPETTDVPRRGLYIECGQDSGAAVLLDHRGVAELGPMQADGSGFKMEKRVDREMQFATPASFRLVLKGSLLEWYLDDV